MLKIFSIFQYSSFFFLISLCLFISNPLYAQDSYIGDQACLGCHANLSDKFVEDYSKTIHYKVLNPTNASNDKMKQGCEACHGPGQAHASSGGGKNNILAFNATRAEDIETEDAVCLTCHKGGEQKHWHSSVHQSFEVGCKGCHTLMKSRSIDNLLSQETEVETCSSCHALQHAQTFRNAHMPLRPGSFNLSSAPEGKMSCSSCHNPHGTITDNLISEITANDGCLKCHADKRGPFFYEHPPVTEDCMSCHDPHGSPRRAMLNLGIPRLCQSCHPTGRHNSIPRMQGESFLAGSSCLQCHVTIHGSNHPSGIGFTR
jgi:DmsE family decaheme c-type cytochrome